MANEILTTIVISALILLSFCSIRPFTEQIANEILSQGQLYLVYVCTAPDNRILSIFSNHCEQRSNCTLINQSNQAYSYFTSFIGYHQQSYFAIIDTPRHFKYICSIDQSFHLNVLSSFQIQFLDNQLQPYFASESDEGLNIHQKCLKLVGKNYEQFLAQDQIIKIVFLYSDDQNCPLCVDFLKRFIRIAKKYFQIGLIRFGFFDVIKNDNRLITDEIAPYFLIYVHDNFEDPYGVGADQIQDLESYIRELLKDVRESMNHDL